MKRFFLTALVTSLMLMTTLSFAKTFEYPGQDPIFAITFPDDWNIDVDEELLNAMPADSSIYLGLWAMDGVENLEAAFEALDESFADLITDVECDDPEAIEINDIQIITIDGKGKTTDGAVDIVLSVALFSPDDETIFVVLAFGTPEAEKKHSEALGSIVNSIQAK